LQRFAGLIVAEFRLLGQWHCIGRHGENTANTERGPISVLQNEKIVKATNIK
jgi:hypothetical protein